MLHAYAMTFMLTFACCLLKSSKVRPIVFNV